MTATRWWGMGKNENEKQVHNETIERECGA
jgi:hypothetical protein